MKKLLRTLQVYFPRLTDIKFDMMRLYRRTFRIPFDNDFRAIALFPDIDQAVFLDVGANRGQSADAIMMFSKNSLIHLFEPNPLLSQKLTEQYRGNHRIVVNNVGLGSDDGDFILYVPYYKKWMYDGLASLSKEHATKWLENRMFFFNMENLNIQEVNCKVLRLDDLNLAPFFIKLDIQGYEYEALKGGEKTIKIHEPILLIESADARIVDFLSGFGYRLYSFESGKFNPGVKGKLNTFFMTDKKHALLNTQGN